MTPAQLIITEQRLVDYWDQGEINSLCHFDGSTDGELEIYLCRLFEHAIGVDDWVLCSHRGHYLYLLKEDKRRTAQGRDYMEPAYDLERAVLAGRSMFLYAPRFIQSAIVAGLCGTAAGLALAIQQRGTGGHVWHFGSDGCEDQGAFYEAVRFVDGRQLPCSFIILDNDRQCGVSKEQRQVRDFAWPSCVVRHRYTPKYPHAGSGGPKFNFKSQTPAFAPTR